MDVNPNSHAEQSRADSHLKDTRPGATAPPKEKKNLEFFHEDVRKSDVECESGPQVESQKVTAGALKPSGPPKWERPIVDSLSDTSRTSECRADTLTEEIATPNKNLYRDGRNYSQKNVPKVSFNFTGLNSLEGDINKGPKVSGLHCAVPDSENQKLSFGKIKEIVQQGQENVDKGQIPPPTQSAEFSVHDVKTQDQEVPMADHGQVVLRSKVGRHTSVNMSEDGESTPSSPSEEHTATDNIAFMITKTAVQVLSSGEVHDIVSQKGQDVQTVNIDGRKETASQQEGTEGEEPVVCLDKKPVIIIFDEPMDIRSAYKRLSTIFEECDEELERMLTEEKIEEEEEDENGDAGVQTSSQMSHEQVNSGSGRMGRKAQSQPHIQSAESLTPGEQEVHKAEQRKLSSADSPDSGNKSEVADDQFESPKKKFKFKFPKKQLAALTQAIRTGTKTGKKTLQVVVYEEEEEDGTLKQHKEAKRFEITRSQPEDALKTMARRQEQLSHEGAFPTSRTDEIRKNTYRTLDSLEQTIKQLENTISEMSPRTLVDTPCSSNRDCGANLPHIAQEVSPRSLLVLDEVPPAPEPPTSISSASRKGSSTTPQTSRMPVPMTSKNRPGSLDKASKPSKLQDPRQYRQVVLP